MRLKHQQKQREEGPELHLQCQSPGSHVTAGRMQLVVNEEYVVDHGVLAVLRIKWPQGLKEAPPAANQVVGAILLLLQDGKRKAKGHRAHRQGVCSHVCRVCKSLQPGVVSHLISSQSQHPHAAVAVLDPSSSDTGHIAAGASPVQVAIDPTLRQLAVNLNHSALRREGG